jgi:hypothetical protein
MLGGTGVCRRWSRFPSLHVGSTIRERRVLRASSGRSYMRSTIAVLLSALLILSASTPLLGKERTVKISISGAGLKSPIEISDPKILTNFSVWTGPGTSTADQQGFIIDWSKGPVRESTKTLRSYQVAFYAGAPPNEQVVYVVYYAFNPGTDPGYVYLPGEADELYSRNVRSIFRGVEGKWFRASSAWERVARPLIEKAEL